MPAGGAGHRAGNDDGQGPPHVLEHRLPHRRSVVVDKRDSLGEQADVTGYCQILAERQDGPEDDITVSVPLATAELPWVELEGLGPVAPSVLGSKDAHDEVAQRRVLS